MKNLLRIEEFAMFLLGLVPIYFVDTGLSWWLYVILFFAPDIGIAGYVLGPKTGAVTYNLFHHKGIAVLLFLSGLYLHSHALQISGSLLFSHSSFDRMFGFGLKYFSGFHSTHLGDLKAGKSN